MTFGGQCVCVCVCVCVCEGGGCGGGVLFPPLGHNGMLSIIRFASLRRF